MINTDFRYFPYIIRDLVAQVRAEYDPNDLIKPIYEFGTYLELVKRISIKDSVDSVKYPLFWLVWEANESVQKWTSKVTYDVRPRLFIVNFTDENYSSVERYDANFIGVLYPVWELFKSYLEYSEFVSIDGQNNYDLADHLYWGESLKSEKNKNILVDYTDAIEIKFEKLEINKIC
jgi:hypothetical protein